MNKDWVITLILSIGLFGIAMSFFGWKMLETTPGYNHFFSVALFCTGLIFGLLEYYWREDNTQPEKYERINPYE